jgi:2-polyprenyl-3-methyl-5-hydroxy-6-metoxy-1,4-benzoquinol methylase
MDIGLIPGNLAPATRFGGVKRLARGVLSWLRLNIRYAVTPGVSLLGLNVFVDDRPGPPKERSRYALDVALALKPTTVLDVGSGGGYHAQAFALAGAEVLCVDYGTSIYAQSAAAGPVQVVHADFNAFEPPRRFGLVWASHVLEHQRDVAGFLERLIACCTDDGYICITVPDPHRNLWGGHLTLWSPGLLAYNVVLCGIDLSLSRLVRGTNEFSLLFQPRRIELPALSYDHGDLNLLAAYLPAGLRENTDPWRRW